MTAPDPTAGEPNAYRVSLDLTTGHITTTGVHRPASPPAVAASTGTSEDVETWAEEHEELARIANTLHDGAGDYDKGVAAGIRLVLASDWLAAREAAARAAERERIAQAIEERAAVAERQRRTATTTVAHDASDEHAWAFHRAARIAREAR